MSSPVPLPSWAEQPERHGQSHSLIAVASPAYLGNARAGKGLRGNQGDYSRVIISCKENPASSMRSWQQWWLHTVFHYVFLVELLLVLTVQVL